jgi:hypothetical protein
MRKKRQKSEGGGKKEARKEGKEDEGRQVGETNTADGLKGYTKRW